MMHHLNYALQNVYFSLEPNPDTPRMAYVDCGRLITFYTAFGISFGYPFHNVLVTICTCSAN